MDAKLYQIWQIARFGLNLESRESAASIALQQIINLIKENDHGNEQNTIRELHRVDGGHV